MVVLKIEKVSVEMRQTVPRWQYGSSTILIHDERFAESLETVWKQKQKEIPVLKVMTTNADAIEDGQFSPNCLNSELKKLISQI
jgi:hypothetical protein